MTRVYALVIPLALLFAGCTDPEPITDSSTQASDTDATESSGSEPSTETGGMETDGVETGEDDGVEVSDFSLEHLSEEMIPPELMLTSDATGIDVNHAGHWDNCCYMPAVSAQLDGDTLDVSYEDLGDGDCDCVCSWGLSYRLEGLAPGTYTVQVGALSSEVTVE